GIVDAQASNKRIINVKKFVEKPKEGTAPSNLAIMGRYILTPDIFKYLEKQEIGAGGEIQLTDAIERLNNDDYVYAYDFTGERFDVGEKLGFVKTTIQFALKDEGMSKDVKEYIKTLKL